MRLSERGTSELALNVLGMSLCDLYVNFFVEHMEMSGIVR